MGNIFALLPLVILVLVLVGIYKTFSKMGYDDAWWALIPLLNLVFFLKVVDKPIWWIVLAFIPVISLIWIYVAWLVAEKVAKAYGKGMGFTVGLLLLGFIFYPILGFGSEQPTKTA
jgi:hypothetical protein